MTLDRLVGSSAVIRALEEELQIVARSDVSVLIRGQRGAGKQALARRIHESSPRASKPFVTERWAGADSGLRECLKLANHGTVLLEEVSDMSVQMQTLLFRFLETGEIQRAGREHSGRTVDVRLLASTSCDLFQLVRTGEFSEDLYYRLNVVHLEVPALQDHIEDVPALLAHFSRFFARIHHVSAPKLSVEAQLVLMRYEWPGNVAELRDVVERLVVQARGRVIQPMDLPAEVLPNRPRPLNVKSAAEGSRKSGRLINVATNRAGDEQGARASRGKGIPIVVSRAVRS